MCIYSRTHTYIIIYIYVFLMRIIQINTHARTDIYSMPYAYIYRKHICICTYMYEIHKGAFTVQHLKRQRASGCQENFIALWSFRRPRGMRNCRKRSAKRFRSRPLPWGCGDQKNPGFWRTGDGRTPMKMGSQNQSMSR